MQYWEESLLGATSIPQIFLHLAVLEDCVLWSRSALKASCRICRRRGDGEKMLLCDSCNLGFHMYCLKPVVKVTELYHICCLKPVVKVTELYHICCLKPVVKVTELYHICCLKPVVKVTELYHICCLKPIVKVTELFCMYCLKPVVIITSSCQGNSYVLSRECYQSDIMFYILSQTYCPAR